ncbi:DNA-directed RNA polymerase subunit beta' [Ruminococcus sp. YE71]|uniref:DNA-directed RNA polymerase subunit beta' n=1 Tax=unclassified Ruminococcus TaxID=2608920 RepID=UPI000881A320|nr:MULTISPECIES: DNA-directed RNA polymerase subunit beta' [unclassified Ruminococcus]SDA20237.1 DNA-directed RNA polymerase subunit beta' [Ruminococcus sp. YE78]SFW32090.1 DNA-directed RNA polymerase subunit beta' [Ruminococcus sp. YE71]
MESNVFESIKISLASPDKIREWSFGEVTRPETINYRTQKPERDGLYCERIFGPTKDWTCHCGKYKQQKYQKGKVCERCGVVIAKKDVRRERMGHIELAAPVSHIWYFKGTPSRIGQILDISQKRLEEVLYFTKYIVIDGGNTSLEAKELLSESQYQELLVKYEASDFEVGMGAEAIKALLERYASLDETKEFNLYRLSRELKEELDGLAPGQKRIKLLKRLEVVEAFIKSNQEPSWMILEALPVIPPDLRPMVMLDGGRYATSDLNDLYRRVINRNNRLKRMLELEAPEIIIRNEKRMLQEAVDALIDNGRHGRPVTGPNNRAFKSLSDMLKGKQGRFRQNLLGKRVDYSGRSVIVVGPELKMYQCGLPKEMALELFKPFVIKRLVDITKNGGNGQQLNINGAKNAIERVEPIVWDALENVIQGHPVLLNRAPTLHRLGIQAFEPILVEGRAIKLHPLVCTAYNADFDGDQMAVHLPISPEAQAEARFLMLAANNLLKPSDGRPVAVPTQDMVLGSYYLTLQKDGELGEGKVFRDVNEALMAYNNGDVSLHAAIKVRITKQLGDRQVSKIVDATVGRLIFNSIIPQDLGFVDRTNSDKQFDLEISFLVKKGQLSTIVERCIQQHGTTHTSEVLDNIKALGYKYSTKAAITVAVCDATIPEEKKDILAHADSEIAKVDVWFKRGMISREERSKQFIAIWNKATNEVTDALKRGLDPYNPINMMADSGARGSINQIRQLAGMRGLIANTSGSTIELPIRANYREGLTILEYFISSRGARKGLADTALRTADSGYLTRRLVDVSQDVIIRQEDCGTTNGIDVFEIRADKEMIEPLTERLVGRYLVEDLKDPKSGEVAVSRNRLMTEHEAERVVSIMNATGREKIKIRSVLACNAKNGVCAKCYGANLANGKVVRVGEAVGVISAQSIGEPGTQLTMRTFHTGGIASAEDITQGLPRVEELFESRRPKGAAIITRIDGTVRITEEKKMRHVIVTSEDLDNPAQESYPIPYGYKLKPNVVEGAFVLKGQPLTEGSINPSDILAVNGVEDVQNYIITEVQKVYRSQGVDINDKHIEVIVRQMMKKVKIDDSGSSYLLPGSLVEKTEINTINEEIQKQIDAGDINARLITTVPVIQGITKASSYSDSFLSAASFQETTKALTDAAIKGKTDHLVGLKENVIIGKLIPAGTGMDVYNSVEVIKNETHSANSVSDPFSLV